MAATGRPPYQPTDEARALVECCVAGGIQQDHISAALGISEATLRKHFRPELDAGMAKANSKIVANLYRQATKDDFKAFPAARFWAENRLGWRQKVDHHHTGAVGSYDLSKVSDDDLARLENILGPVADARGDQSGEGEEE